MISTQLKEQVEALLIKGVKPRHIKGLLQLDAGVDEIYTISQKMKIAGRLPYRRKVITTTGETIEILPCPFCGKHSGQFILVDTNAGWVQCSDCTATGPYSQDGKAGAINLWNNRKGIKS